MVLLHQFLLDPKLLPLVNLLLNSRRLLRAQTYSPRAASSGARHLLCLQLAHCQLLLWGKPHPTKARARIRGCHLHVLLVYLLVPCLRKRPLLLLGQHNSTTAHRHRHRHRHRHPARLCRHGALHPLCLPRPLPCRDLFRLAPFVLGPGRPLLLLCQPRVVLINKGVSGVVADDPLRPELTQDARQNSVLLCRQAEV